jgi:dienelactone hydrolase
VLEAEFVLVAVLLVNIGPFPNIRGSSGFGKTFLTLDNGLLRENAYKDIGSLLDWVATQPDLDASRVMVTGASYGGNVALVTAMKYPGRITLRSRHLRSFKLRLISGTYRPLSP